MTILFHSNHILLTQSENGTFLNGEKVNTGTAVSLLDKISGLPDHTAEEVLLNGFRVKVNAVEQLEKRFFNRRDYRYRKPKKKLPKL